MNRTQLNVIYSHIIYSEILILELLQMKTNEKCNQKNIDDLKIRLDEIILKLMELQNKLKNK